MLSDWLEHAEQGVAYASQNNSLERALKRRKSKAMQLKTQRNVKKFRLLEERVCVEQREQIITTRLSNAIKPIKELATDQIGQVCEQMCAPILHICST